MELKHLYTFKTLKDELSFTRAAERLNYAQSSVSAQIQSLEAEFGAPLFRRLGKRITLTDAGRRLERYAEDILHLVEEAKVRVPDRQEPSGTLTVGSVESLTTYRLAPILGQYRERFPNVELVFRTGICGDLRNLVANGTLDAALTLEPAQSSDVLVFEHLFLEPMWVLASPSHRLTEKPEVNPSDLVGETILVTEPGCSYREMFEGTLAQSGISSPMKIEFASIEAIKECIRSKLGVSLLPQMAVRREVESGQLTRLNWCGPEFPILTQLCWHKSRWISPALSAFIDLIHVNMASETPPGPDPESVSLMNATSNHPVILRDSHP